MKTIVLAVLLVICFTTVSYAQKTYSYENLERMSPIELNEHYLKALKLEKTGKTVNKVGMISFGIGLTGVITAAATSNSDAFYIGAAVGLFGGLIGLTAWAVGIPIKETGKARVNRINTINAGRGTGTRLNLKPSIQYNAVVKKYQPGVTLAFQF